MVVFTGLCNCCKCSRKDTKALRQVVVAQTLVEGSSRIYPCKVQFPSNLHKSVHTGCGSGTGTDQLLLHGTTTIAVVSKLKERWTRYSVLGRSRQRKKGDAVALFVSTNAEYVSVAVGNRIIILRKHDGYASPCGVYTSE